MLKKHKYWTAMDCVSKTIVNGYVLAFEIDVWCLHLQERELLLFGTVLGVHCVKIVAHHEI